MKKAIFSVMMAFLLVCASLSSFGLKTNTEIYNIIQMSKEYNSSHGIKNPNEIWPGQILTFLFEDGTWNEVIVEKGDNQWKIIRKLDKLKNEHGEIISPVKDTLVPPLPQPMPINYSIPEPFPWWASFPWGWLLVGVIVVVVAAKLLEIRYNNRRQNPVTAGTPQVQGGVSDENAYNRVLEIARSRFPGAHIDIKNIRRGWLSGLATVFYAGNKTKKLRIKDVDSYAGEALINGREQTIYFLQGCGNDARGGNYMTGDDLHFRARVIINQDGSESPLPIVETATSEIITEEEPSQPIVPVAENPGSESFRINMRILEIHEKAVEAGKGNIYEETIDFNEGVLGTHIKYQSDKKSTDKSVSEKSAAAEVK